jgi:hypothetical protein
MIGRFDWRSGRLNAAVREATQGSMVLTLVHGCDELVFSLSPENLDSLTWACLRVPRPRSGSEPEHPAGPADDEGLSV